MTHYEDRLLRIGIFYDGNYFLHVSNYYCYAHPKKARLSIPGLHEFIKKAIAEEESIPERLCQIVDCHYFRGRLPAQEANQRQILLNERKFDDILMREGVVTHYLPMSKEREKGVDVSLALEALELTIFKKYDVVVMIASDGDYVPLVRKLNALGARVMVLGWDFEYMDKSGKICNTMTSARLMKEVTYPIRMHDLIDGVTKMQDASFQFDSLFVQPSQNSRFYNIGNEKDPGPDDMEDDAMEDDVLEDADPEGLPVQPGSVTPGIRLTGHIVAMKNGYGFIEPEQDQTGDNVFFFWQDVESCDFNQLRPGDRVEYEAGINDRGACARKIRRMAEPENTQY